jgi:hypothetical protein
VERINPKKVLSLSIIEVKECWVSIRGDKALAHDPQRYSMSNVYAL